MIARICCNLTFIIILTCWWFGLFLKLPYRIYHILMSAERVGPFAYSWLSRATTRPARFHTFFEHLDDVLALSTFLDQTSSLDISMEGA